MDYFCENVNYSNFFVKQFLFLLFFFRECCSTLSNPASHGYEYMHMYAYCALQCALTVPAHKNVFTSRYTHVLDTHALTRHAQWLQLGAGAAGMGGGRIREEAEEGEQPGLESHTRGASQWKINHVHCSVPLLGECFSLCGSLRFLTTYRERVCRHRPFMCSLLSLCFLSFFTFCLS